MYCQQREMGALRLLLVMCVTWLAGSSNVTVYVPGRLGVLLTTRFNILMITSLNWLIQQQCLQDASPEAHRVIDMTAVVEACVSGFLKDSSHLKHFNYQFITEQVFSFGSEQVEKA